MNAVMKTRIAVKKISPLLILLLFLSTQGISQGGASDSLIALLKVKSGPERVDLLFEIAWTYEGLNNSIALNYAEQGFDLALQSSDTARIVKLGRTKAQFLRRLSKVDSAINLLHQLAPIAKRHHLNSELASMLNSLGTVYVYTGEYDKALHHLFDALSIREKEGNVFYICSVLNNIGLTYYSLGDFEKALSFYKRAVQMKNNVNDESELDLYYANISLCYAQMRDLTQAQIYIDRAVSMCKNNCSKTLLMYASHCRGIITFHESNLLKAESEFLKTYKLSANMNDKRYSLNSIAFLLRIYTEWNRIPVAEKYLNKADAIVSTGAPYPAELRDIYYQAIKLFRNIKSFEKMSLYQDRYIALRDSVFGDELTTNLMKIEAEHLEKENLAKIESQNKILTLNAEIISTHKLLNIFVGIVALLLIVLIIVLVKSNRLKQKHNVLLDKKVQERTHQLRLNHDSLQRASQERDILLEKISADIGRALATLQGLCAVGMKDLQEPNAREYISKMHSTSDSFSHILAKLQFIRSGAGTLK